MGKSKIKQRLEVYKKRLCKKSPGNHKSYAIPRKLPEVKYYHIEFKKPLNVRIVNSWGYVLIDPTEISHTIGYHINNWMIFLYRGRRCGLPFDEFTKLRDGCLLTMKAETDPLVQAFNEHKRQNFKYPKHEPQNSWEIDTKYHDPLDRLRQYRENKQPVS